MKVRDVIKLIEKDGWFFVGQEGSHRQYRHAVKKGRVTISGHRSDDMPKKIFNYVLKQSGLK
jgi:predicted RNA binding protein YcfA (HicA-like mRNA interferase family)